MQLAASCWLVVYLFAIEFWDACNAHDTSDTYYDIIIMTIVILVKSSEPDLVWMLSAFFTAFPALFSVLHVIQGGTLVGI